MKKANESEKGSSTIGNKSQAAKQLVNEADSAQTQAKPTSDELIKMLMDLETCAEKAAALLITASESLRLAAYACGDILLSLTAPGVSLLNSDLATGLRREFKALYKTVAPLIRRQNTTIAVEDLIKVIQAVNLLEEISVRAAAMLIQSSNALDQVLEMAEDDYIKLGARGSSLLCMEIAEQLQEAFDKAGNAILLVFGRAQS